MLESKITVVIPTYNRCICVGDAVRSVLAQSHPASEIIVVDDGSTDDTPNVLAQFGNQIQVLRQDNSGVSMARNAGIHAASGDWIAFLDSDDVWHPDKLRVQATDLALNSTAVAHAVDCAFGDPNDSIPTLFALREINATRYALVPRPLSLVLECAITSQTMMVRRDVALAVGGFPKGISIFEDTTFFANVALKGAFVINPYVGAVIRRVKGTQVGLTTIAVSQELNRLRTLASVYSVLLVNGSLTRSEKRNLRGRLGGVQMQIAAILIDDGQKTAARKLLWKHARLFPSVDSAGRAILGQANAIKAWHFLREYLHPKSTKFLRSIQDKQ